jgi:hypothetical protein
MVVYVAASILIELGLEGLQCIPNIFKSFLAHIHSDTPGVINCANCRLIKIYQFGGYSAYTLSPDTTTPVNRRL